MGLNPPEWLGKIFGAVEGTSWPALDEDQINAAAGVVSSAGKLYGQIASALPAAQQSVLNNLDGQPAESFSAFVQQSQQYPGLLAQTAQQGAEQMKVSAAQVLESKVMILLQLAVLAAQIAWLVASPFGGLAIPVLEEMGLAFARLILTRLGIQMATGAAFGAALNGTMSMIAEGIASAAEGVPFDWSMVVGAVESGAMGGAIGGAVMGGGELGLAAVGAKGLGSAVQDGAVHLSAGAALAFKAVTGGAGGAAGAMVMNAAEGGDQNIGEAILGGFIGGLGPGEKSTDLTADKLDAGTPVELSGLTASAEAFSNSLDKGPGSGSSGISPGSGGETQSGGVGSTGGSDTAAPPEQGVPSETSAPPSYDQVTSEPSSFGQTPHGSSAILPGFQSGDAPAPVADVGVLESRGVADSGEVSSVEPTASAGTSVSAESPAVGSGHAGLSSGVRAESSGPGSVRGGASQVQRPPAVESSPAPRSGLAPTLDSSARPPEASPTVGDSALSGRGNGMPPIHGKTSGVAAADPVRSAAPTEDLSAAGRSSEVTTPDVGGGEGYPDSGAPVSTETSGSDGLGSDIRSAEPHNDPIPTEAGGPSARPDATAGGDRPSVEAAPPAGRGGSAGIGSPVSGEGVATAPARDASVRPRALPVRPDEVSVERNNPVSDGAGGVSSRDPQVPTLESGVHEAEVRDAADTADMPADGHGDVVGSGREAVGPSAHGIETESGNRPDDPSGPGGPTGRDVAAVGSPEARNSRYPRVDEAAARRWQERFRNAERVVGKRADGEELLKQASEIMQGRHQPPPPVRDGLPDEQAAYARLHERIQYQVAYQLHLDREEPDPADRAGALSEKLREEFGTSHQHGGPGGARGDSGTRVAGSASSGSARDAESSGSRRPWFGPSQDKPAIEIHVSQEEHHSAEPMSVALPERSGGEASGRVEVPFARSSKKVADDQLEPLRQFAWEVAREAYQRNQNPLSLGDMVTVHLDGGGNGGHRGRGAEAVGSLRAEAVKSVLQPMIDHELKNAELPPGAVDLRTTSRGARPSPDSEPDSARQRSVNVWIEPSAWPTSNADIPRVSSAKPAAGTKPDAVRTEGLADDPLQDWLVYSSELGLSDGLRPGLERSTAAGESAEHDPAGVVEYRGNARPLRRLGGRAEWESYLSSEDFRKIAVSDNALEHAAGILKSEFGADPGHDGRLPDDLVRAVGHYWRPDDTRPAKNLAARFRELYPADVVLGGHSDSGEDTRVADAAEAPTGQPLGGAADHTEPAPGTDGFTPEAADGVRTELGPEEDPRGVEPSENGLARTDSPGRMPLARHAQDDPLRVEGSRAEDPFAQTQATWRQLGVQRSRLAAMVRRGDAADAAEMARTQRAIDLLETHLDQSNFRRFLTAPDEKLRAGVREREARIRTLAATIDPPRWKVALTSRRSAGQEHARAELAQVQQETGAIRSELARRAAAVANQRMVPDAHDLQVVQSLRGGDTREAEQSLRRAQDAMEAELRSLNQSTSGRGSAASRRARMLETQLQRSREDAALLQSLRARTDWAHLRDDQVAALVLAERRGWIFDRRDRQALVDRLLSGEFEWAGKYPAEAMESLADRVHAYLDGNLSIGTNLPLNRDPGRSETVLDKLLRDPEGKLRNFWETGTSEAQANPAMRGSREEHLGYAATLNRTGGAFQNRTPLAGQDRFAPDPDGRAALPKYAGYVSRLQPQGIHGYGDVVLHWKDSVRGRSTFTPKDSLDSAAGGARGVTAGHHLFGLLAHGNEDVLRLAMAESTGFAHDPELLERIKQGQTVVDNYIEVQMHGDVTLADVDHFVINYRDGDEAHSLDTKARLEQYATEHGLTFDVQLHRVGDPIDVDAALAAQPRSESTVHSSLLQPERDSGSVVDPDQLGLDAAARPVGFGNLDAGHDEDEVVGRTDRENSVADVGNLIPSFPDVRDDPSEYVDRVGDVSWDADVRVGETRRWAEVVPAGEHPTGESAVVVEAQPRGAGAREDFETPSESVPTDPKGESVRAGVPGRLSAEDRPPLDHDVAEAPERGGEDVFLRPWEREQFRGDAVRAVEYLERVPEEEFDRANEIAAGIVSSYHDVPLDLDGGVKPEWFEPVLAQVAAKYHEYRLTHGEGEAKGEASRLSGQLARRLGTAPTRGIRAGVPMTDAELYQAVADYFATLPPGQEATTRGFRGYAAANRIHAGYARLGQAYTRYIEANGISRTGRSAAHVAGLQRQPTSASELRAFARQYLRELSPNAKVTREDFEEYVMSKDHRVGLDAEARRIFKDEFEIVRGENPGAYEKRTGKGAGSGPATWTKVRDYSVADPSGVGQGSRSHVSQGSVAGPSRAVEQVERVAGPSSRALMPAGESQVSRLAPRATHGSERQPAVQPMTDAQVDAEVYLHAATKEGGGYPTYDSFRAYANRHGVNPGESRLREAVGRFNSERQLSISDRKSAGRRARDERQPTSANELRGFVHQYLAQLPLERMASFSDFRVYVHGMGRQLIDDDPARRIFEEAFLSVRNANRATYQSYRGGWKKVAAAAVPGSGGVRQEPGSHVSQGPVSSRSVGQDRGGSGAVDPWGVWRPEPQMSRFGSPAAQGSGFEQAAGFGAGRGYSGSGSAAGGGGGGESTVASLSAREHEAGQALSVAQNTLARAQSRMASNALDPGASRAVTEAQWTMGQEYQRHRDAAIALLSAHEQEVTRAQTAMNDAQSRMASNALDPDAYRAVTEAQASMIRARNAYAAVSARLGHYQQPRFSGFNRAAAPGATESVLAKVTRLSAGRDSESLSGGDSAGREFYFSARDVNSRVLADEGHVVGMTFLTEHGHGGSGLDGAEWVRDGGARSQRTSLLYAGERDVEHAMAAGAFDVQDAPWGSDVHGGKPFFVETHGKPGSAEIVLDNGMKLDVSGTVLAHVVAKSEVFQRVMRDDPRGPLVLLACDAGQVRGPGGLAHDFSRTLREDYQHDEPVYAATNTVFLGHDSQEHAPVTAVLDGGGWEQFPNAGPIDHPTPTHDSDPTQTPPAHGVDLDHEFGPAVSAKKIKEQERTFVDGVRPTGDVKREAVSGPDHSAEAAPEARSAEPSDSQRAAQEQAAHAELIAARADLSAARHDLATTRDQTGAAQDGGVRSEADAQQQVDRAWERLQRASRTLAAVAVPPERPAPRSVLDDPSWLHSKAHTAEWFEPEARPVSEADIQRGRALAPVSLVETEMRDVWREPDDNNRLTAYGQELAYDVRRFTVDGVGVQDYTIRLHLERPLGAGDASLDALKQRVREVAETYFNPGYRVPSGDQFHLTVEFVPTKAGAHDSVEVVEAEDRVRSTSGRWWSGAGEPTLAHELGHLLGLRDTYVDEKTVFQQPGSRRIDDTGLMGEGYDRPGAQLKPRDLYLIETVARSAGSLPEPESSNYRTGPLRTETDSADRVNPPGGELDLLDVSAEDRSNGLGLSSADAEDDGLDDLGLDLRSLSPRTSGEVYRPWAPPGNRAPALRAPVDRGEGSSRHASRPYSSDNRPSRHAPGHGSGRTAEQWAYQSHEEVLNDLRSTWRQPSAGPLDQTLGPDIFGLRAPQEPPAFMARYDYRLLTAGQGVSLFEKLDLASSGRPTEADMDPSRWRNTEQAELRGAPRSTRHWAPTTNSRLDRELTLPKAIHSIWLGGPLTDQRFMDNLANTSRIGRDDHWAAVLWTDVGREEFEAARQAARQAEKTGGRLTPRFEAVRAMQLWARHNEVKLVNVGEVFNARQPLELQHAFVSEMNKQAGPGFAAASDILRLEILERFGGVYSDGDNEVHSLEGMQNILDSQAGFAIHQDFVGQYIRRSNAALVVPKGHPFVRMYRRVIEDNYKRPQWQLEPQLHQPVAPGGERLDRARRNSVMYRTGPTAARRLLETLGLDPGNSPTVDGITINSDGSWFNPPTERSRVRSADRAGTLLLTQRVVSTLVRDLYNRGGDLNLVLAQKAVDKHENPDLVWNAAIHFIASDPYLAAMVVRVTYAVSDGTGQHTVVLPQAANNLVAPQTGVAPVSTMSGETYVPARLQPIAPPTQGAPGAMPGYGWGR
ncbi:MAG TPA: hypothetical protein VFG87_12280 [Amycolatopsis sp.]|nr:hypothetical protein [Amycolatopsis sp.]